MLGFWQSKQRALSASERAAWTIFWQPIVRCVLNALVLVLSKKTVAAGDRFFMLYGLLVCAAADTAAIVDRHQRAAGFMNHCRC